MISVKLVFLLWDSSMRFVCFRLCNIMKDYGVGDLIMKCFCYIDFILVYFDWKNSSMFLLFVKCGGINCK